MKHVVRAVACVTAATVMSLALGAATANAAWCAGRPSANGSCEPIMPTK